MDAAADWVVVGNVWGEGEFKGDANSIASGKNLASSPVEQTSGRLGETVDYNIIIAKLLEQGKEGNSHRL